MSDERHIRKPVQLSLFEQRTVPVSWVIKRWKISRNSVLRLLESGLLRGYRITPIGWWRVFESSVQEHEKKLNNDFSQDEPRGGKTT